MEANHIAPLPETSQGQIAQRMNSTMGSAKSPEDGHSLQPVPPRLASLEVHKSIPGGENTEGPFSKSPDPLSASKDAAVDAPTHLTPRSSSPLHQSPSSLPLSNSQRIAPLALDATTALPATSTSKDITITGPLRVPKAAEPSSRADALPSSRLLLQALQRHLKEEMLHFMKEGIKVADSLTDDGVQTYWVVQVKRWNWAPQKFTQ
jgi:hypothetical protein